MPGNRLGVITLLFTLFAFAAQTAWPKTLFRDEFDNLEAWEPLYFKKIESHTNYTIASEGEERYLRARSHVSASAIVYKREFNVYQYPWVEWQWRVENVYQKGNAKTKEGDDYPLRVYIIFKFDPEKAEFVERVKYKSYKLVYNEYPPHSSLNYIWANREHGDEVITSAYSESSKMIPLQRGGANLGKWLVQKVNIVKDYQRAFGRKPPALAKVAVMNDSDNTKEGSVSYINYIQVYKQ